MAASASALWSHEMCDGETFSRMNTGEFFAMILASGTGICILYCLDVMIL